MTRLKEVLTNKKIIIPKQMSDKMSAKPIMTRLKKVLDDKKMKQKELSVKSEIGEYKISLLCSGKATNIHLATAKKICDVLNCTLDQAFGDVIAR